MIHYCRVCGYWLMAIIIFALVLLFGLMMLAEWASAQDEGLTPEQRGLVFYSLEPTRCGYYDGGLYCSPILVYRFGLHREWWWAL